MDEGDEIDRLIRGLLGTDSEDDDDMEVEEAMFLFDATEAAVTIAQDEGLSRSDTFRQIIDASCVCCVDIKAALLGMLWPEEA
ncbi:hypothetical protein [Streptomyces hoynatensis]|uniref:Uncharacterized protein n=1 Tax=Streptomyces hoynatensis TaxID=1141874 RepID=A0A3A9YLI9_9ACTN|nr:hypothetical protein [Streptomyces hoynatensis]RKN35974.1 hypothetical protein D7294_30555 [Streptomyces hoynatensis]